MRRLDVEENKTFKESERDCGTNPAVETLST